MARLTMAQVYGYARRAGFDPASAVIMSAIAMGESGLNPDAIGDVDLQDETWGPSVGLAQIRTLKKDTGTGRTRDIERLRDPLENLLSAFTISHGGKDFTPWTVYTKGTYRKFVGQAQNAAKGYVPGAGDPVSTQPVGLLDVDLAGKFRDFGVLALAVMLGIGLLVAGAVKATGTSIDRIGLSDLDGGVLR